MTEIPKGFTRQPVGFVKSQGDCQSRDDFRLRNRVLIDIRESRPLGIPPQVNGVFTQGTSDPCLLANQPDIGCVGASTSVRTSRHMHSDPVVLKTKLRHFKIQLVDDPWQGSFRFGD